jgi:very-short-patch-repair endonuclease
MGDKRANSGEIVAMTAAEQHGVITLVQLNALGIGKHAVSSRVAAGKLHRLHRGVYSVGHPNVCFEGRCLAAVLALGKGAVLSHQSAAELWGLMKRTTGPIHVTLSSADGRRRRKGIRVHRSRTLGPGCVAFIDGVRATTPERTLRDLRRSLDDDGHRRATRKAFDLGLVEPDGAPESALTRSELERRFLALCRRHRLPQPEVNARLGRYEVDFLWREAGVVVELDGYKFHRGRDAFEWDRARDVDLQTRGLRVLRFTWRHLRADRKRVVASLRRVLSSPPRT